MRTANDHLVCSLGIDFGNGVQKNDVWRGHIALLSTNPARTRGKGITLRQYDALNHNAAAKSQIPGCKLHAEPLSRCLRPRRLSQLKQPLHKHHHSKSVKFTITKQCRRYPLALLFALSVFKWFETDGVIS